MKKNLQTAFHTRQYMLSKDFEIYYYDDRNLKKVDLHTHDYYEFYFFLEGDVSIQIGKKEYPFQFGDIMLVPPHVPHRPIIHSVETPYRRFVFWISQEYCNHLLELSSDYVYLMQYVQVSKTYVFHNDRITFNAIQSRILRLLEEMHSDHFGRKPQISLYVNDLILYMNRLIHQRNNPKSQSEEGSLYFRLLEYIEEHLDEDLSLEKLALEFYVSKYHIAHVFKEHLGMSIHQYITKKRLALCHEAILGNMSITEAYRTFGFGDYSSFYRAFKKEYGISPKDFKDMQMVKYE
ncbi:MAG: AraC family transcriptional regulator [Lachnospiraceae bacterium]|nr:AraC family transcriptional regulator [Robinsoniella sp.]MDY3765458.1 AraC family transcriptional regulator [Lachnospiraceae bacterium]